MPRPRKAASPFRYFNSSPEVIRLVVLMYVRFPLSLRDVEDLLFERGIDISHETVRYWWNRLVLSDQMHLGCPSWLSPTRAAF
jgi:putative transposase